MGPQFADSFKCMFGLNLSATPPQARIFQPTQRWTRYQILEGCSYPSQYSAPPLLFFRCICDVCLLCHYGSFVDDGVHHQGIQLDVCIRGCVPRLTEKGRKLKAMKNKLQGAKFKIINKKLFQICPVLNY